MDRDRMLTPRVVEGMIADGHTIVVFEDSILRLDSWLNNHPGGRLAILHMVGKDATDEIRVYHSATALKTMTAHRIGRKPTGPWPNMTPPIRGGIYRKSPAGAGTGVGGAGTSTETIGQKNACYSSDTDSVDDNALPDDDDDDDNRLGPGYSNNTSMTSSISLASQCSSIACRATPATYSRTLLTATNAQPNGAAENRFPMSTARYIDSAVQRETTQDLLEYPSLDPAVQQDIVYKYRLLRQQVEQNFYNCPYAEYGKEVARYVGLFVMFLVALRYSWYITSAAFLGLFWHQIMFTAHDAGHMAITHNFILDSLIGMFIADFCCGLSIGWWKSSHNVHHLITNQPEHDPDIQNVPLFATSPLFFRSLFSTYYDFTFVWDAVANVMVPWQAYTYYPIMGIARFNLYLLSWQHVLSAKSSSLGGSKAWWVRPTEFAFMTCYWYIFGYCLIWCTLPTWTIRIAFVLVSHIITMPLHVQITLSHWGMSTSELGESESFPQRQLRTTMDVDCPAWLDFIHGGLQFQVVHHLFPRVPRHNLRRLQVLVREFCEDTGIPYSILGFVDGNRKVLGRLQEVAQQVNILISCQQHMAETRDSGLSH